VTWLADNAGIVAAASQHEGGLIRHEMKFVNGVPGSDVIGDRTDDEVREPDISDRYWPPLDFESTLREIVLEKQPTQVFGMHAVGHPRGIGIPGHQVIHWLPSAEQVLPDVTGPDEIV
jgi:hypothetical protein